jgi:hypothetical protein
VLRATCPFASLAAALQLWDGDPDWRAGVLASGRRLDAAVGTSHPAFAPADQAPATTEASEGGAS